MPDVQGLSKTNTYYCRKFYQLYKPSNEFFHHLEGKTSDKEIASLPCAHSGSRSVGQSGS